MYTTEKYEIPPIYQIYIDKYFFFFFFLFIVDEHIICMFYRDN